MYSRDTKSVLATLWGEALKGKKNQAKCCACEGMQNGNESIQLTKAASCLSAPLDKLNVCADIELSCSLVKEASNCNSKKKYGKSATQRLCPYF